MTLTHKLVYDIFDDKRSELFEKVKGEIPNLSAIRTLIALVGNTKSDNIIEAGNFIHLIVLIIVPHYNLL